MKAQKFFLALLILSAVVILTAGCCGTTDKEYVSGGSTPAGSQSTPASSSSHGGQLEILSSDFEWGQFGNLYVVGTAKNTGDRAFSYAQVDVKFFDKDGVLLQTMLDNINDLGAGESWKFKVVYLDMDTENVASYKIAVGSCF